MAHPGIVTEVVTSPCLFERRNPREGVVHQQPSGSTIADGTGQAEG